MKEKISKIGERYREAFRDFRADPPESVWQGLERNMPSGPAVGPRFMKPMYITGTAVVATIIGVVAYFTLHHTGTEDFRQENMPDKIQVTRPAVKPPLPAAQLPVSQQNLSPESAGNPVVNRPADRSKSDNLRVFRTVTPIRAKSLNGHPTSSRGNAVNSVSLQTGPAREEIMLRPVIHGSLAATEPHAITHETANGSNGSNPRGDNSSLVVKFSNDTTLCRGSAVALRATGGESYQWSGGETMDSIRVSPAYTTVYRVTVTLADGSDTIGNIRVKVLNCESAYVPNAFSPNGDGKNEVFLVKGNDIQTFHMKILSRSGQIIFETDDLYLGWDGRIRGEMAPAGIYLYQISYTDSSRTEHEKTGQVMLLR